jgi:phosphoribosyl 1,2-cyclic phosphodiesterase
MRFASLGSGSDGNGLVFECGDTRILIDCGFGLNDTVIRLGRLGLGGADIDAILVTHEHDDHVGGVARLARKFDIPVYLSYGTLMAVGESRGMVPQVNVIDSHTPFVIGDVEVFPFPVPHDSREPTQFVLGDGDRRFGMLTDAGMSTPHIEQMLSGLDALVLECNHDLDMLMGGAYPPSLKQRISGRLGHLANDASAALLKALDTSRLKHCVAAHLSRQNNTAALARAALSSALSCEAQWIAVATQDEGFSWLDVN